MRRRVKVWLLPGVGAYVSMCSTKFTQDKTMHHCWGISRRISRYLYKMGLWYSTWGKPIQPCKATGKRPQQGSPVPVYTEELGLAFDLTCKQAMLINVEYNKET